MERKRLIKMTRYLLYIGFLLWGLMSAFASAETVTVVPVYTSASFAPLVMDGKQGLYPDLVEYLNRQHIDGLVFQLEYLPRKRLQVKLENNQIDGVIIGMMPKWLADEEQKKYLWTVPFIFDHFLLVSTAAKPFTYDLGPEREGGPIGVTLGYVYPGIDEWIQRHRLVRTEVLSEEQNIDKLLLGRVGAAVVTESVLRFYLKSHPSVGKLSAVPFPVEQIERRFLAPKANRAIFERLAPVIRAMRDDPVWHAIRARYE
jgi:polar amino acid transport system substrate-binding protein